MNGWNFREHEQKILEACDGLLSLGIDLKEMQLIIPQDPIPDGRLWSTVKPETCLGMKIVVDKRLPPDAWYISGVQMDRES